MARKRSIVLLVHNVRSLWNVGSFFRTCDAFDVERVILTGYTPVPPRKEISKTAIGAEKTIPWTYEKDPIDAVKALQKEGFSIVSLERVTGSVPLCRYTPADRVCLVAGNELAGVPEEIRNLSDAVVEIPMLGKKESLNVSVAAGIALYHLRNHL